MGRSAGRTLVGPQSSALGSAPTRVLRAAQRTRRSLHEIVRERENLPGGPETRQIWSPQLFTIGPRREEPSTDGYKITNFIYFYHGALSSTPTKEKGDRDGALSPALGVPSVTPPRKQPAAERSLPDLVTWREGAPGRRPGARRPRRTPTQAYAPRTPARQRRGGVDSGGRSRPCVARRTQTAGRAWRPESTHTRAPQGIPGPYEPWVPPLRERLGTPRRPARRSDRAFSPRFRPEGARGPGRTAQVQLVGRSSLCGGDDARPRRGAKANRLPPLDSGSRRRRSRQTTKSK